MRHDFFFVGGEGFGTGAIEAMSSRKRNIQKEMKENVK